uniref:Uncharacterized protein n=1 Tax=Panagrolaimus sp. JU765 TaxID=591449 RepID=A0AC34RI32_9BILA
MTGKSPEEQAKIFITMIELEDEIMGAKGVFGADVVDKKLEMLKTAMKDLPGSCDLYLYKVDLIFKRYGMMENHVTNAWKEAINKFPNNLNLWRKYLTFYRSLEVNFDCAIYEEKYINLCLTKLGGIISGQFISHPKLPGTEDFIVDVIISSATMAIESGRIHKMITLIQLYIEFYLMRPKTTAGFDNLMKKFEEYWNMNVLKPGFEKS